LWPILAPRFSHTAATDNSTPFTVQNVQGLTVKLFSSKGQLRKAENDVRIEVRDASGNLYGTTYSGGHTYGTVFKLDASGKETVLHSFTGGADGQYPSAGLARDSAGNLYGTTSFGGTFGPPVA